MPAPDFVKAWQARAKSQAAKTEKDMQQKGKTTPAGTEAEKPGRKRKPQTDVGKSEGGKRAMLKKKEQAVAQCMEIVDDRVSAVKKLNIIAFAIPQEFSGFSPEAIARSQAVAARLKQLYTVLEAQLAAACVALEEAGEALRREEERVGLRHEDTQEALHHEEAQESLHCEDSVDQEQAKATASGERRKDIEAAGETEQSQDGEESVPRYPRRQRPEVNYVEPELADEDEYLFCDQCQIEHQGMCPTHGKLQFVVDRQLPKGYKGADRAERTLPQVLALGESSIKGAGLGVWARKPLPEGIVFGPYEGVRSRAQRFIGKKSTGYSWIIKRASKVVAELDAADSSRSNWMRFVNCAAYKPQQNAMPFQFQGRLYYRTVREVPAHTELMVYYGDHFARQLGIDTRAFHRGLVSRDPPAVFVCSNCQLGFTSPIRRDRHERLSCRQRRFDDRVRTALPYFEPLPRKVPAAFELSAKLNEPGPEGRKRFKCGECRYSTDHSGNLKQHMVTHTLERAFGCPQCPYKATLKSALEQHLKTHSGEKPHACTECDYRAARKAQLTRHMRTHTGEKPYKCQQCDAAFSNRSDLLNHERALHTKERPFGCTQCAYTCVRGSHLASHMLTHSGQKKLSCTQCSYKCNQAHHLTDHMSSRHNVEKKLACSMCDYKSNRARDMKKHVAAKHAG